MIIPRFAKMGSTKLDILSKMYDELMSDPQVHSNQLDLDYVLMYNDVINNIQTK